MEAGEMGSPHVAVIGGGLAGLSASVALSSTGCRVSLIERSPRLGGRASSYVLPDGECIDNCQHVTLPCCTNLTDFYGRIGVAAHIRYYDQLMFADSKGRRSTVCAARLPAPLHLFPSFATFGLLGWADKLGIARALLRIIRSGGQCVRAGSTTMLSWLNDQKQTGHAIDHFWKIVLISALNEELDRMDASHGVAVFWKAFLSSRDGYRIGIPGVPLADLYSRVSEHIEAAAGRARTRCGANRILFSGVEVSGIALDDGNELVADYYVAALPFDRLLKLLPEEVRSEPPFRALSSFAVSPITSIHMWFARPVMQEPFIVSVDQTIQWVFNKTRLSGHDEGGIQYLQVVISASRALAGMAQSAIVGLVTEELQQLIPEARGVEVKRAVVVRENAATFSPEPGTDCLRPGPTTPIHRLYLAGDWTQTGWPATMESAVRSGYRAAEAILEKAGLPVSLVQPDVSPTGLARWVSSKVFS